MDKPKHSPVKRICKKIAIIFIVVSFTQYVFAVDGTMNGGGSKSKKASISSIKKNLNLNLRSEFSASNKTFNSRKGQVNTMMSFKRGNVTIFLPYKTKPVLQKFKTPMAPAIR